MKSYRYDKGAFRMSVTVTGVFCILIGLYSLGMLLGGNSLFWFVLLICLYQVYNTFFSVSNPQEVTVSEDSITFSAYGKTHAYRLEEIASLRVKELDQYKKMYVRVNEPTLRKGRYWIHCGKMNDGRELWEYFSYLEYVKEPGQLKFRARTPVNPLKKKELDAGLKTESMDEKS